VRRRGPRRGQTRVIEALLSSVVVVVAMGIASGLIRAPSSFSQRRTDDASRFAYSLLTRLAEADTFDKVMFEGGNLSAGWEDQLKVIVGSMLPSNAFFNMTIGNCTVVGGAPQESLLTSRGLSNAMTPEVFQTALGVGSADIVYTTKTLWILRIHIDLAYGD